ncbi:MAG: WD40 repeat domain-containing protein [Bradyrhizobium sp.]|uniref:WD40 repeat domain-containing protein n=1 Tax=Bradyrhizobium sp. TaxID=376 RepID=UPI003D0ADE43
MVRGSTPLRRFLIAMAVIAATVDTNQAEAQPVEIIPQVATEIFSVAISDGARLLATGGNRTATVWDVRSGRQVRHFFGYPGAVVYLGFTRDEDKLLVGTGQSVRLLDIKTGATLKEISAQRDEYFRSASLSPDETKILIATYNRVLIVDVKSREQVQQAIRCEGASSLDVSARFSVDGRSVHILCWDSYAAGRKIPLQINIWDPATGRMDRRSLGLTIAAGFSFNSDHTRVVAWDNSGTISLIDARSGNELRTQTGPSAGLHSAYFGPNGGLFLFAKDSTIRVWDVGWKETRQLSGIAIVLSQDERSVFVSGELSKSTMHGGFTSFRSGKLLSTANWDLIQNFSGNSQTVSSVTFSSDGASIISGTLDNAAYLWSTSSGERKQEFNGAGAVASVALSSRGKMALTGTHDDHVILWDVQSGRQLRKYGPMERYGFFKDTLPPGYPVPVKTVAISQDESRVFASTAGTTAIWDMATGNRLGGFHAEGVIDLRSVLSRQGDMILRLAKRDFWFQMKSSNGKMQRTKGMDQEAPVLQDAISGRELKQFEMQGNKLRLRSDTSRGGEITAIALLPDATGIIVGDSAGLLNFEGVSTKPVVVFRGHHQSIASLSLSSNGQRLLSADWNGEVRIWDVNSARELTRFSAEGDGFRRIALSPDATKVAYGSFGGSIKLLDASSGSPYATFISFGDIGWIAITPEGFFDASSSAAARNLNVVRDLEVYSIDQVHQALYRPDLVREKLAGDPKGLGSVPN